MKTRKLYIGLMSLVLCAGFTSCDDFLDKEPESVISPEVYFTDASQLQAYADGLYTSILPSHRYNNTYGIFGEDKGTDNQIGVTAENRYTQDLWKVPNTESSDWNFELIYRLNYFFANVLPKFGDSTAKGEDLTGTNNTISGDLNAIKHYIGEMYFLRACEYFSRYQKFGDFPIITEPLSEEKEQLVAASKRMPRNEVARFILSDLDKAIELLGAENMATTRINKDAALLFKSRVALFEGTWLKYFKGTAFVPNGEGWPGKAKDYNANYQYPSGSIDAESKYFLGESMKSSKEVAEKYKGKLTVNTGVLQQSVTDEANPYFDMFAQEDLSGVSEVLLWRQYSKELSRHNVCVAACWGNYGAGLTRSYVNSFLMEDGLPVYKHGDYANGDGYYEGDKTLHAVRQNRDSRLALFLKEPGQKNILYEDVVGETANLVETAPLITDGDAQRQYPTGYALRKGGSFYQKYYHNSNAYTGAISYRATEALLNYIEASYEYNFPNGGGSFGWDLVAAEYWRLIRQRAHVSDNIQQTIDNTEMSKEAENDWGAYSKGAILTDKVLYNIRRERRSEFIAEGLRYMDLCRWRSMDQMITKPYIPEGFHLWNTPMQGWYSDLVADGSSKANVSPESKSEYLRPYQKNTKQTCYDGFIWHMAHYLTPIMAKQFLITSSDGKTIDSSPLYQNPYWPTTADMPAEK